MSFGATSILGSGRVSSVEPPPGMIERTWKTFAGDLLVAISLVASRCWRCGRSRGLDWRFGYRTNYVPPRSSAARVDFQQENKDKTRDMTGCRLRLI
ncbi:MAG: hypothetical protein QM811_02600 [Pirellulales bacterium]